MLQDEIRDVILFVTTSIVSLPSTLATSASRAFFFFFYILDREKISAGQRQTQRGPVRSYTLGLSRFADFSRELLSLFRSAARGYDLFARRLESNILMEVNERNSRALVR